MDSQEIPYQRLSIYQTKARLYIVGYCKLRGTAALLKISKQEPTQLDVAEVVGNYNLDEIRAMLSQIHMANAHLGGLQLVTHCCGIIGCFRFTETYYLLLVTRKAHVGSLCGGHKVYTVAATALVPLHPGYQAAAAAGQPSGAAEKRYVKLLMGMDLTKHFYFSYTYNLTATVQQNCRMAQQRGEQPHVQMQMQQGANLPDGGGSLSSSVYDSMFTWNSYLTSALRWALSGNSRWTVPLIHGFWEQRRLSIYGRPLTLTLIARRSRHFAGTRYRKRGINDGGKVANEVETEQVVDVGIDYRTRTPLLSSVVQVRGSVPLFWSQQLTALSPKPEIILQQFDPLYEVTEAHFSDLEARYGSPVVVLNLLKSKERRPREVLLRRELAAAIAQLNAQRGRSRPHIVYIPWDFSKHAKQSGANLLSEIAAITRLALDMTGLFVHNPNAPVPAPAARSSGGAPLVAGLGFASPRASNRGSGGGAPSGRPGVRVALGSLRRAAGDGGSSMHLAAAAEAAAAAVRARHATAAMLMSRGSGGGALSSGISSPPTTARPSLEYYILRRTSNAHSFGSAGGSGGSLSATQWQSGVLRTNCIDCLDRTNVAQFAFGLVAFGRQLYKLGLHDVRDIDGDSSAAFTLMALYEAMGHVLSLQYGGSEAHTIVFQRKKGEWEAATQSKDFVTSIKRLYSNTYTDAEKQDAINLFLGNFVPVPNQPHLWQLDTDQYLHSETTLRPTPPPSLLRSSRSSSVVLSPPTPALPVSWCSSERSSGSAVPFDEPTSPTMVGPAPAAAARSRTLSRFDFARASSDWTAMATVAAAAAALGASPDNESASAVAAAVCSAAAGGGARFPGLPPESTPLPLELSSDDDDDSRSRSYRDLSGPDVEAGGGLGAGLSSTAAAAAGAAAYASAAIPFHRAPSSGNFFAGLLPAMGRGSGGGSSSSGPGLFERMVTSLLQPGGAGAAARSAAAGVAGGDVAGGAGRPGRQLVSFDRALARPPNQVWPILLHGEEDKQGRWAAVQSAFSFFWTSNAIGGAGDGSTRLRNNYQLDDAPRPQVRHSQNALPARLSTPLSPTPSGTHTPLSPVTSMPLSPDPSRHGGASHANAAAGGGGGGHAVSRTLTVGTDGGMSVMSDGSPRSPAGALTSITAAASAAAEGPAGSRCQSLRQILDAMVDVDHTDQHHGRDTAYRTVAETIPALGGSACGDAGPAGAVCGGTDEDDAAYYYSAGDGEAAAAAAAGQLDGAGGARQGVRKMLSGSLLTPTVQPIGSSGKQSIPGSAIPVLNDFIEVIGGPASYYTDWRCLGEGHTLDPVVRRKAVAEAAARAREEERQRKLVTAGLEVNDILALGLEDLGLNWELQPWWALEPRPRYVPRPYEPQPGLLLNVVPPHEKELLGQQQLVRQGQGGEEIRHGQVEPVRGQDGVKVEAAVLEADFTPLESLTTAAQTATAEKTAPGGCTPTMGHILQYEPPPVHALQRKQQVEHMAFVHFDVAQTHARDKFGNFLGSIAQPYGLYGEERRRDIAMYDAFCYIEQR